MSKEEIIILCNYTGRKEIIILGKNKDAVRYPGGVFIIPGAPIYVGRTDRCLRGEVTITSDQTGDVIILSWHRLLTVRIKLLPRSLQTLYNRQMLRTCSLACAAFDALVCTCAALTYHV